ncbi:alpha/beta hydrolase [Candidatus Cytomitobacter indipagum]|uniref:Alpha/beta hydrolase n=1 Tax=Candidatus Cytomitobacter indipagum TaxID=2601575 RepID=A0A5C0UCT6_9PROT|nr:alpha/beta fold hydrolase [Candidatus Cytomitobacter indipagum]QEK37825.1 alpha/beta hydrolase [Candidatus Cytomitobacter indipagum]
MIVNKNKKYSSIMIQRKYGALEGKYSKCEASNLGGKSAVLILHPDSACGGSMKNKVVKVLGDAFATLDFDVLRINFRGVGKSQGKYDGGVGELDDALDAIDWLNSQYYDLANIWVAGFGFGGLIAIKSVMRRPNINGFISISPPKESQELNPLTPCSNGLLIVGENDHTVEPDVVKSLTEILSCQKNASIDYKCVDRADHYFSDHMNELEDTIYNYIHDKMLLDSPICTKKKNRKLSSL